MSRRLFKELERSYGFDEVAIVPGDITINPEMTSTQMAIGDCTFEAPMMASAMDGTVSPRFAGLMHDMGGLGVLNGEGLYSRYDDPYSILEEITSMPQEEVTQYLQQVYAEPIKKNLIGQRVQEIKGAGATCANAFTPQNTKRMSPLAVEAGADIVVVQSTVTTARHYSHSYHGLIFSELIESIQVPVVVGNCVSYNVAMELMEDRGGRHSGRRGSGRGLHHPGGNRSGSAAGERDAGVRRRPTGLLPPHRAVRFADYRRGDSHRGRPVQGHSQRRRRGDGGHALCPGGRGAGAGGITGAWPTPTPSCPGDADQGGDEGELEGDNVRPHVGYQRDAEPGGGVAGGHGNVVGAYHPGISQGGYGNRAGD